MRRVVLSFAALHVPVFMYLGPTRSRVTDLGLHVPVSRNRANSFPCSCSVVSGQTVVTLGHGLATGLTG